jgi:hypothetical protein
LRDACARDIARLVAISDVIAVHSQTIAAASDWRR